MDRIIKSLKFKFPYSVEDWKENMYMENYHYHTMFSNVSTADSPVSNADYSKRILELKGKCLFSGEHGNQGNQFEVYNIAEETGLKYVHSTEAYWVKNRLEQDSTNCHICIIGLTANARRKINLILSIANEDGYYYKPRIDIELIKSLPKDEVIITSACIAGWKYEDADKIWLDLASYFGDNFFFEVQYHNTEPQKELNQKILKLAKENDIQIIAGLDSHYIETETEEVLRNEVLKYKKIFYDDEEGWYLDFPDTKTVIQRFREQGVLNDDEIYTAILNTNVFYAKCQEILLDKSFKIPVLDKELTYDERVDKLKTIINEAYAKDTYPSKEKIDGIRWEVEQIVDSRVMDYFLTNYYIIKKAIEDYGGVLTTTSRGSSASFIINKLLGFTTIDRFNAEIPIYPQRFLTKERVLAHQLPDIDFNTSSQEPFIQATKELLGEHGCYPLMAVEYMKEKAAWQLYASVSGIEPQTANEVSKSLDKYNDALKYADESEKEFIKVEDFIEPQFVSIYEESKRYQGIVVNLKVHACGVILFDGDVREEIGLISAVSETTKKRTLCACIEGGYLDSFGYVKNDYLIVDVVGLIDKCFKSINQPVPTFEELKYMIKDDGATWDIYRKGITCCVNQVERGSTTQKVMEYKPQTIAELAAFIAGIRPGFASLLPKFLKRQNYSTGENKIDELLADSAHYMIYQESIMKVLSFLKLPMGDTYGVIKSISKKKLKGEKKENLKKQLVSAWKEIFGNSDKFNEVWNVIEDSARYSFNCVSGDTLIHFANGVVVRVDKMLPGKLYSLFENKIYENNLLYTYPVGKRDVYSVETESGKFIKCTIEHKFPTPYGELQLKDLNVGDIIFSVNKIEKGEKVFEDRIRFITYKGKQEVYGLYMDDPAHNFVVNDGIVTSNSPHALSMAGDSLYLAWFKAHHTAKFYETAINHYQIKGNKNKIKELTNEAIWAYGYRLGEYKFGQDNRRVNIDEEKKVIYPSLNSVKDIQNSAPDILYKLKNENPETLWDMFELLSSAIVGEDKKTKINKKTLDILIKIDYFSDYGDINYILEYYNMYNKFATSKTIAKDKLTDFEKECIKGCFGKETDKQYRDIDNKCFVANSMGKRHISPVSIYDKIKYQVNFLGSTHIIIPEEEPNAYVILEKDFDKYNRLWYTLYQLNTGETAKYKVNKKWAEAHPFEKGDSILAVLKTQNKRKKVNNKWIEDKENQETILELCSKIRIGKE